MVTNFELEVIKMCKKQYINDNKELMSEWFWEKNNNSLLFLNEITRSDTISKIIEYKI